MLALPEKGFARSTNEHNGKLSALSDWIESSVLFEDVKLSKSDAIDVLLENEVYDDQDFAKQWVDDGFAIVDSRQARLGDSRSLRLVGQRLERLHEWTDLLPLSFCLAATLRTFYRSWSKTVGTYNQQGLLFERLVAEAFEKQGWNVHRTGWSGAADTPQVFEELVTGVADAVRDPVGILPKTGKHNDAELDIVCHYPFHDDQGGHAVFLVQCASGENWTKKQGKPVMSRWRDMVRFTGTYNNGIAVPFSFPDDSDFLEHRIDQGGLFWDRYRILVAGRASRNWLSQTLSNDLRTWLEPVVATLPRL